MVACFINFASRWKKRSTSAEPRTDPMRATDLAHALAQRAEGVCHHLLPLGRVHGRDWCCGSLSGEPGNSLKIRLDGSKAGVWADFGGDAGDRGDLIGLWQRVRGVNLQEACEEATRWLGLPDEPFTPNAAPIRPTASPEQREPSKAWLRLQKELRGGTVTELAHLANLRKFPAFAGLQLATNAGQLFFADVWDDGFTYPSWIITDGSRRNAQARRMDGKIWDGIQAKAKTIQGCEASWPVGIADVGAKDIALVEGGPDFLAAWYFIWATGRANEIQPVAMFGANNRLHTDALPLFNRKVWMFIHDDKAGESGAATWKAQIEGVGGTVYPFRFAEDGVKDLNDFLLLDVAAGDEEGIQW
jgi:hypothetical protein